MSFEEQSTYENEIRECAEEFSQSLEKEFGGGKYKGVKLEFTDEPMFRMQACLTLDKEYRGKIILSRLLIIAVYQTFYGISYDDIIPDEKNIDNIKHILFIQAFTCMVRHEIAHIYKGHLQLYQKWEREGKKHEHILDIKTLEWDADSYAATQLAFICREAEKAWKYDTTEFFVKNMCLAIHGMMYWQRMINDFEGMEEREHLPSIYREVAMFDCIRDCVPEHNMIVQYFLGYEKIFNDLFGIKSNELEDYYKSFDNNAQEITRVTQNWENVKEQLKPYSIFPLEDILS